VAHQTCIPAKPDARDSSLRVRHSSNPKALNSAVRTCGHRGSGSAAIHGPRSVRSTERIHSGLSTHELGRPSFFRQLDLPSEVACLCGERDDRDLRQRVEHLFGAKHHHGSTFIWRGKPEPPDIAASNHGNSSSPSSVSGPWGPRSVHCCHSRACVSAAIFASASPTGSSITRTRCPSKSGTSRSRVTVLPWT